MTMLSLFIAVLVGLFAACALIKLIKNYLPQTWKDSSRIMTTVSIVISILVGLLVAIIDISVNGPNVLGKVLYMIAVPTGTVLGATFCYDYIFSVLDAIKTKLKK